MVFSLGSGDACWASYVGPTYRLAVASHNRQPAIFLGYRVSRAGLGPAPKALRRLRRQLRHADALEPDQLVRGLLAFRGLWRAIGGLQDVTFEPMPKRRVTARIDAVPIRNDRYQRA